MKFRLRQWLLMIAILLSACMAPPAVLPSNQGVQQSLPLLPPASLGASHQVTQLLHGEYADKSFSLQCAITTNADKLSVICLTSMGLRAFTLNYDGKQLTEQRAPQLPDALRAEQLLNDLQLAFWPLSAIQQSWRNAGVQVTEPYPGTRRVERNGTIISEVHYSRDPWEGRVWLHQNQIGYSLYIESSVE